MAIVKDFFRQVMGQFATGVSVVTARNRGTLSGITVNAFCSVSLDPPLVLVCIDLTSNTLAHIRESGAFAVNILTNEQEDFSRCFASSSDERYEYFCHANYQTAATGSPIIDEALAFIDARIVAEYPGGDHVIFLGQVEAMGTEGSIAFASEEEQQRAEITVWQASTAEQEKLPLAYYRGTYRHLACTYRKPSLAATYDDESK